MRSVAVAALCAADALAAPLAARDPPNSPYHVEVEDVFTLVARVTKQRTSGAPLAIDNFVLASAHVGAGQDQSLLVGSDPAKSSSNPFGLAAEMYVQNGTTEELEFRDGYVERYPPQSTDPTRLGNTYGITVLPNGHPITADTAGHGVFTEIGVGSKGVSIAFPYTGIAFPEDQPVLSYVNTTADGRNYKSQFYACEASLYGDAVVEVFWRSENATTPDNCAEFVLFAQCAGNATDANKAAYHTVQGTPCYKDASNIPYVGYSS